MPRMSRADILEAAGTVLLIPGAWTQGHAARNASGHFRCTDEPDATSFCALGALWEVISNSSAQQTSVIDELAKKVNTKDGGIIEWNDAKGQTAENVAKTMFELAAELRAKR